MNFLMPMFLWLIVPLVILFIKGSQNIIVKTHILILILLLFTLARPIQEEVLQKANIQAQDIIIAIDISYSMQAKDISPTRYLFAKETIKHLLHPNLTDNIMLIAFTTNPLLLSPPSTDHALINIALENLNPEFILSKGTSLKRLFTKLASLSQTPKTLILMSDGGEEDNIEGLSRILANSNISLITLALGSKQGTTLSKKNATMLKDKEGDLVITRRNPLLENLTHQLKGTYFTASTSPEETAHDIHTALKENKSITRIQKEQRYYKELYQIPLLIATLLFLLVHTAAVKYLIILFTFLGLPLQASLFDSYFLHQAYKSYESKAYKESKKSIQKIKEPSLQGQILLANTYYKDANYKKAIHIYKSIKSTSISVKQNLYYNIANAYVHLHAYTKAKLYYSKALQLGFDKDTLHNLQLSMLLEDKKSSSLGIAHPKSQSSQTSKSASQKEKKDEDRNEDKPSSASGSGDKETSQKRKKEKKLIQDNIAQKHPLGSKVYELINKGYIHETQPW